MRQFHYVKPPPTRRSAAAFIRRYGTLAGGLLLIASGLMAQSAPALEFFRLRPGAPWAIVSQTLIDLGADPICRPATDRRIVECRGRVALIGGQNPYEVIVSLVHDSTAVILLSGQIEESRVTAWVNLLDRVLGPPRLRRRGSQRTWEWIRNRQMLRMSYRPTIGLVVNLTDGPLLDGLDQTETLPPAGADPRP